jgi:3-oxoacyl-[acyl-carrier protein] reductase
MIIDDLKDKTVIITGASSGIGAAVARAFGRQGAAVAVHFHAHSREAEVVARDIASTGGKAITIGADLMQRGEAARVVRQAASELGGIDVLINNAGSLVERVPFRETPDDLVDRILQLNINAVIEASLAAVPYLEARKGTIINVGSIAGNHGGGPGSGIYGGAKAFVHNLTRHLANDLAPSGIRVNAISPGVIGTPFHAKTPAERMELMRKSIPLARIGVPEDCVGAFLFLASPVLSGYITGQNIHINGGQLMP